MFQHDLLADKVIVITGGGTGLGRAIGERFLELGAKLAITSRRDDVLRDAAAQMSASGGEVFYTACDVRVPEQVSAMVDAVMERYGKIDILVNNAAGNFVSPTEKLSTRAFDAVVGIVLHGTVNCTLEVGKRWIAAETGGTMLNIVTTYASSGAGSGYVVPSAIAKSGVLTLTRSLAVEWAKYGIRQVAIAPGLFPTEGAWSRLLPTAELAEQIVERVPMRRVGEKQELCNLAAYLVSDQAAYINGEVVVIDGGEWLRGAGQFNDLERLTEAEWAALSTVRKR
ncbi:MAG: SDR family oxidoreductase [Bacilli bacterium]